MRHLFVVSRDHLWLYGHLRERFQDDPNVDVILDRRITDRRRVATALPDERRRQERRRVRGEAEDLRLRSHYIVEI